MCGPGAQLGSNIQETVKASVRAQPKLFPADMVAAAGGAPATDASVQAPAAQAPGVNPVALAAAVAPDADPAARKRRASSASPFRTDLSIPTAGASGNGINIPR